MISLLRGIVAGQNGNAVIIDVGGVGYLTHASGRTLAAVGNLGSEISLLTVMIVREDAILLYGFQDEDERDVFEMLLKVQQVGPRVALAMLSVLAPSEIMSALATGDAKALSVADGVGPKLAARLVTELRDKATLLAPMLTHKGGVVVKATTNDKTHDEVRSALGNLGFSKVHIESLLASVLELASPPKDTASILSACLRMSANKGG